MPIWYLMTACSVKTTRTKLSWFVCNTARVKTANRAHVARLKLDTKSQSWALAEFGLRKS